MADDAQPQARRGARRVTRPRVRVIDSITRVGITLGGIAVIIAVLGILVYLTAEVLPLFKGGSARLAHSHKVALPAPPVVGTTDEYRGSVLLVLRDGTALNIESDSGEVLWHGPLIEGAPKPSAFSTLGEGGAFAVGFEDGSVSAGSVGFQTDFLTDDQSTAPFADLGVGDRRASGDGYVERTPEGQIRRTRPRIELTDPTALASGEGAVARLDFRQSSGAEYIAALRADGSAVLNFVRRIVPLGGGKPRLRLASTGIEFRPAEGEVAAPDWLFVLGDGSSVIALWKSGIAQRYARADAGAESMTLMETVDLAPDGASITEASMLLGAQTLILGLGEGTTLGAFVSRQNTRATPDAQRLVVAHRFAGAPGAVTASGISQRDRSFVTGNESGDVTVRNMTSQKTVARLEAPGGRKIVVAQIAPKTDGVVAVDEAGGMHKWDMNPGHADSSITALFGRVWYEGEPAPGFTYQAHAGTDNAEPKMSLTPLIFGTIKATVYAMLFAVPIAVLAAIYTSEMLHPRVRLSVKPLIEVMASLPSVVLGFIAAMVIAPFAKDWVPAILLSFVVLPYSALFAAYLWQMLPIRVTARLRTWQHLAVVMMVMLAGLGVAWPLGDLVERVLFTPTASEQIVLAGSVEPVQHGDLPVWAQDHREFSRPEIRRLRADGLYERSGEIVRPVGTVTDPAIAAEIARNRIDRPDIRKWLDGGVGAAFPGWMLIMTPAGLALAVLVRSVLIDQRLRALPLARSGLGAAGRELIKFVVTICAGLVMAGGLALLVSAMGFDARDSFFGPFSQRNTLVVAIVMGFAIIPIIYTISEDALSSVPGQLRSASLGCGATRWQTATRVILPVALSGIFSACMIGLGRAAGETMIVLMATGNTPSMEWNIFSGFRTLAANIAVEMPEAPKDSTHFRVLFLAGLCLFVLTFFVNTGAEILRQRVRRRGAAL